MSYQVDAIPALSDNYIWCIHDTESKAALIVDPGEAAPALDFLERNSLTLEAVLLTHHHPDHTQGVGKLIGDSGVPVHGPADSPFGGITNPLREGDTLGWRALSFQILAVPGHTRDHIAFNSDSPGLSQPITLCGDALFACGCGRLFEGNPAQMRASLVKLREWPDNTLVCCGHEYTRANVAFARAVTPDDTELAEYQTKVERLREAGQPSVPTTLGQERRLNPFLRWDDPAVVSSAETRAGEHGLDGDRIFGIIREWKDGFRG
ncbi:MULTISPECIES: hydroxyacylglutathione hydrolase [Gammaproteobacteria]|jgi:hydroxyacylglutathione hydrolase|uniref:Hydroxyacylglutathione hydrolase n=2 Tax=Halomonadaceae TaxID=28256 RepID=A0A2A2F8M8_9GAMM|nr:MULTISPECIES: hydroxyacylglutathione hydrolase [Gammaproteobacteria]KAA8984578.1 hydroxyacylglutathione hydrolase [Halospina sp. K52047b]MYL27537.1 hydroxyacylglutathione hydrolase [Halomonas utahensis]MYL74663.1 hydroxyacylglutathione hydrolase [Halomonas sp. 22501_18_FS]PAU81027.1 hydroxyacylglutathione hydrolase [Halovibrio salipaludis]